jgi:hypothetical protein
MLHLFWVIAVGRAGKRNAVKNFTPVLIKDREPHRIRAGGMYKKNCTL